MCERCGVEFTSVRAKIWAAGTCYISSL